MRRRDLRTPLILLAACLFFEAVEVRAIPVFARKYGVQCTMCHSAVPRLNDFGARYRQNGYRLPGLENTEQTVLEGPAPFAMRTSAGYLSDKFSGAATDSAPSADVVELRLNGLDFLSAGLITDRIGYFLVYKPPIEGQPGLAAQSGSLEMASLVLSHLGSPWINLRVGRFEPAFVAVSVKRRLSFSPYEIYDYRSGSAALGGSPGIALAETQTGIEMSGEGRGGLGYALGWVEGGAKLAGDSPQDLYLRLFKVFGAGEGQTAGQRIGLVGYAGKARAWLDDFDPPLDRRQDFTRLGVDASLNFQRFNLALQYLWGKDDKALWGIPTSGQVGWSGGFAELSFQPTTSFVAFARYDLVDNPDLFDETVARTTLGARYYLVDNCALYGEYSRREQKFSHAAALDLTETLFTVGVDFMF